jgi:integrase/recombinase XerD
MTTEQKAMNSSTPPSTEEFVRHFLTKNSLNTNIAYDVNLRIFAAATGKNTAAEAVAALFAMSTPQVHAWMQAWVEDMQQSGTSNRTIIHRLAVLKSLTSTGERLGLTNVRIFLRVPRQKQVRDNRGPTEEQFAALLKVPDVGTVKGLRDFTILRTAYELGLRSSELRLLCCEDYGGTPGNRELFVHGKGGKNVWVAVSESLEKTLNTWLE